MENTDWLITFEELVQWENERNERRKSGQENNGTETEIEEKNNGVALLQSMLSSRRKDYQNKMKATLKFACHFFAVLLLLFCGAVVFAYLEEGDFLLEDILGTSTAEESKINASNTANSTMNSSNISSPDAFWHDIEKHFEKNITIESRQILVEKFKFFLEKKKFKSGAGQEDPNIGKVHIFQKWFYFVVISASTIGYGDLYPTTENGKIFFIFFSLIGILLFISLLKRAGSIISAAQQKMVGFFLNTCLKVKQSMSKEIVSLLSLFLIFCGYLVLGIWYSMLVDEMKNWSLLDTIYYWIITFTTVGFGDMTYSLQLEMDHMPFFILYRVFGLSLIAAIIDAIDACIKAVKIKERKDDLQKKLKELRGGVLEKADMLRGGVLEKADMLRGGVLEKADMLRGGVLEKADMLRGGVLEKADMALSKVAAKNRKKGAEQNEKVDTLM